MGIDDVLERICRLPANFYSIGSKSIVQLISESGIDECPSALSVPNISAYFTTHPELVQSWLLWSANKRVSSGWYFLRRSGGYAVGFYPRGEALNIAEPELACAEFVVREVQAIMSRMTKPSRH